MSVYINFSNIIPIIFTRAAPRIWLSRVLHVTKSDGSGNFRIGEGRGGVLPILRHNLKKSGRRWGLCKPTCIQKENINFRFSVKNVTYCILVYFHLINSKLNLTWCSILTEWQACIWKCVEERKIIENSYMFIAMISWVNRHRTGI